MFLYFTNKYYIISMANTTLCNLYTKQFEEVSDAISTVLTTGKSYSIAGRSYDSHDIGKLEELQQKYLLLMNRNCGATCGIKTVRVVPL